MASGTPLTDEDRWPWLDRIASELSGILARGGNAVLACSALKQAYRERLARAGDVRFVHLTGDFPTIAARIATRQHRYMPASLLASQFATLEPPADALEISVADPVDAQIARIRTAFGLAPARSATE
jgi:carbohydrate kinase (thermoresistant glucokinase family)